MSPSLLKAYSKTVWEESIQWLATAAMLAVSSHTLLKMRALVMDGNCHNNRKYSHTLLKTRVFVINQYSLAITAMIEIFLHYCPIWYKNLILNTKVNCWGYIYHNFKEILLGKTQKMYVFDLAGGFFSDLELSVTQKSNTTWHWQDVHVLYLKWDL